MKPNLNRPANKLEWSVLKSVVWKGPLSLVDMDISNPLDVKPAEDQVSLAAMKNLAAMGLTAFDRLGYWIATPAGRKLIESLRKSIRKLKSNPHR